VTKVAKTLIGVTLLWNTYLTAGTGDIEPGLLVGDPVGISLRVPVGEDTAIDVKTGIWAWHLWHDTVYDTPFVTADYLWWRSDKDAFSDYMGIGFNVFFKDNPKESYSEETIIGIRVPFGWVLHEGDGIKVELELAPFAQVQPFFLFEPYILDLNGGVVVRF